MTHTRALNIVLSCVETFTDGSQMHAGELHDVLPLPQAKVEQIQPASHDLTHEKLITPRPISCQSTEEEWADDCKLVLPLAIQTSSHRRHHTRTPIHQPSSRLLSCSS